MQKIFQRWLILIVMTSALVIGDASPLRIKDNSLLRVLLPAKLPLHRRRKRSVPHQQTCLVWRVRQRW